jgi:hypothetical protein
VPGSDSGSNRKVRVCPISFVSIKRAQACPSPRGGLSSPALMRHCVRDACTCCMSDCNSGVTPTKAWELVLWTRSAPTDIERASIRSRRSCLARAANHALATTTAMPSATAIRIIVALLMSKPNGKLSDRRRKRKPEHGGRVRIRVPLQPDKRGGGSSPASRRRSGTATAGAQRGEKV